MLSKKTTMRKIIFGMAVISLSMMFGCQKTETQTVVVENDGNDYNSTDLAKDDSDKPTDYGNDWEDNMYVPECKIVTVQEFKDFYHMTDEVPDDYIEAFIEHFAWKKEDLEAAKLDYVCKDSFSKNEQYGYSIGNRMYGYAVNAKLSEFMPNTKYIYMDLAINDSGNELTHFTSLVIDFNHHIICYGGSPDSYNTSDYVAELTEEDEKMICREIVKHVSDDLVKSETNIEANYSFFLRFIDDGGNYMTYQGNDKDENNFPGFDEYWKTLFKHYFKAEYNYQ